MHVFNRLCKKKRNKKGFFEQEDDKKYVYVTLKQSVNEFYRKIPNE